MSSVAESNRNAFGNGTAYDRPDQNFFAALTTRPLYIQWYILLECITYPRNARNRN